MDITSPNISVFIITYNEENNIDTCLKSVLWSNDIVILDSYSNDNTILIAKKYESLRVFKRHFDNYSSQRNYGLKEIDFLNQWVLIIDADETCDQGLREEILSNITCGHNDIVAYRLRRKTFFYNKWLKHNSIYNVWIERLVKPGRVTFYGNIHEKLKYEGKAVKLSNHINHYPFSKGIEDWISRRNRYSTLYAENELSNSYPIVIRDAFSQDPIKNRVFLNAVYRRLPLRWLIFFLYNFFIKFCFLDGLKGIHMVLLESYYEFLIVCKIKYQKDL